jgi:hypothetical protein
MTQKEKNLLAAGKEAKEAVVAAYMRKHVYTKGFSAEMNEQDEWREDNSLFFKLDSILRIVCEDLGNDNLYSTRMEKLIEIKETSESMRQEPKEAVA